MFQLAPTRVSGQVGALPGDGGFGWEGYKRGCSWVKDIDPVGGNWSTFWFIYTEVQRG